MKKILIVLLSCMFVGCAVNDSQSSEKDNYPKLQIVSDGDLQSTTGENYYINKVALVNYVFEPLYLPKGESQTFVLDKGMPAGYDNIQVFITYDPDRSNYISYTKKVKKSFKKGKTTVVRLSETASGL